jgi:hypothetical protein
MSFEDLKKNRANAFDKLKQAAEKISGNSKDSKSYDDSRFWKPTIDKAGNGYAVIRFLPSKVTSEAPYTKFWDHAFKGPRGAWYFEKSLTTLDGAPDPVSESNAELWATGLEENKQIARDRKRKLHYVCNVYVVSDPAHPENEGKVFLYKHGSKVFEKYNDKLHPQFEDEQPMNPFDMWEGANLKIKIRKVEGYVNYDKSEFESCSPLSESDEKLEEIYGQLYSLKEFTDPSTFKTYEELKEKLDRVLGKSGGRSMSTAEQISLDDTQEASQPKSEAQAQVKSAKPAPIVQDEDEDDDTLSYFKKLASQG